MKRLLAMSAAIALLAAPAAVLAQTSTTSPSATTQDMMSLTQLKQKLEKQGYSDIKLQPQTATSGSGSSTESGSSAASKPEYVGTATKDGKLVNIEVNSQGEVTEK